MAGGQPQLESGGLLGAEQQAIELDAAQLAEVSFYHKACTGWLGVGRHFLFVMAPEKAALLGWGLRRFLIGEQKSLPVIGQLGLAERAECVKVGAQLDAQSPEKLAGGIVDNGLWVAGFELLGKRQQAGHHGGQLWQALGKLLCQNWTECLQCLERLCELGPLLPQCAECVEWQHGGWCEGENLGRLVGECLECGLCAQRERGVKGLCQGECERLAVGCGGGEGECGGCLGGELV